MNHMNDQGGKPQLLEAVFYSQSALEGHEACFAGDHRSDTTFKAHPYYQWLLADCLKVCHVSYLKIRFPETDGYYHYHIETSLDRMNWDLLLEKADDSPEKEEGALYTVERDCRYLLNFFVKGLPLSPHYRFLLFPVARCGDPGCQSVRDPLS